MTATAESEVEIQVDEGSATILAQPLVTFGPEIAGDLGVALRREWLVTNGLGGYASGTVAGTNTRRYHGLLVAALNPPVERTVLVAGSVEWVTYDGHRYPVSTHEYGGGTIDPHGYRYIQCFELEGTLPVWTFAVGDALLEKRVWMAHDANTTCVRYRLVRGSQPLDIEIAPLVTYRDFHSLSRGGWELGVSEVPDGIEVRAFEGATPFRILATGAQYSASTEWYWNFLHREETARGLDDRSDLYLAGQFSRRLRAGDELTLVLTTELDAKADADRAFEDEQSRESVLLERAKATRDGAVVQQLVLAADQFIVRRDVEGRPGKTVIAGYHWSTTGVGTR